MYFRVAVLVRNIGQLLSIRGNRGALVVVGVGGDPGNSQGRGVQEVNVVPLRGLTFGSIPVRAECQHSYARERRLPVLRRGIVSQISNPSAIRSHEIDFCISATIGVKGDHWPLISLGGRGQRRWGRRRGAGRGRYLPRCRGQGEDFCGRRGRCRRWCPRWCGCRSRRRHWRNRRSLSWSGCGRNGRRRTEGRHGRWCGCPPSRGHECRRGCLRAGTRRMPLINSSCRGARSRGRPRCNDDPHEPVL